MNSHPKREIADLLRATGCNEYSSRTPVLKLGIAPPGVSYKFAASSPSTRKPRQAAGAVWVVLLLAIAIAGTFWATNQLCGLLAQKMQQMQRQRYRPQTEYSDLWNKGRHQ